MLGLFLHLITSFFFTVLLETVFLLVNQKFCHVHYKLDGKSIRHVNLKVTQSTILSRNSIWNSCLFYSANSCHPGSDVFMVYKGHLSGDRDFGAGAGACRWSKLRGKLKNDFA